MSRICLLSTIVLLIFVKCKSITKPEQLPTKVEISADSKPQNKQNIPTSSVKEELTKDNDPPVKIGGECIVFKDIKKVDCPNSGEKVCGCNNKTYANKCEALRHVSWYSLGSCE